MKQETLVSNATPRELREYQVEAVDAVESAWAQSNNRVSVVLPTGTGKAEPVTNEIPTPKGIRRFGDLEVGDDVYGPQGKPVRVTAVHAQGIRKVYRITFSDGVSTLADGEHLWEVHISGATSMMVKTTKELLGEGLLDGDTDSWRFQIPLCQPTSGSRDVPPRQVREQKIIDHIFINKGTAHSDGSYTVPVTHDTNDIQQVVWSMGGTATRYPTCLHIDAPHITHSTAWFRGRNNREPQRFIISIEPAGEAECRCITVDHPTSLYLTGRAHIVTHNSTVIASVATRARKEGKKVLLLAHRTELLDQMAGAVQAVDPSISEVGIVAADRDENHTDIVAASFQTLARSPKRLAALGKRDVILADECFPAGTRMSDGTPIEDVRVGDMIQSWDEETHEFTSSRVGKITVAVPSSLVRVVFEDGTDVVCTHGHPFLSADMTWVNAENLRGATVVRKGEPRQVENDLHSVRHTSGGVSENKKGHLRQNRACVLHDRVQGQMALGAALRDDGGDEPEVCLRKNEIPQPDAQRGSAGKDGEIITCTRAPSCETWRKWESSDRSTDDFVQSSRGRMAARICSESERQAAPSGVSCGHWSPQAEAGDRGRR